MTSNVFQYNNLSILNKYISCINHCCNYNSIGLFIQFNNFNIPIIFMAIYAIRDIEENEEIFIMYGSNVGHDDNNKYHNFHCNCGLTDEERNEKYLEMKSILSNNETEGRYTEHRDIIRAYCRNQLIPQSVTSLPSLLLPLPPFCEMIEIEQPETMKNVIITQLLAIESGVYKASDTQLLPLERFHEYIKQHYQITENSTDNDRMNALYDILQRFDLMFEEYIQNLSLDFHN